MNSYKLGEDVKISGAFTNSAGQAVDPTTVKCQYRSPSGVITTLTFGTDAALLKASAGNYYTVVDANEVGRWHYRFYATGTGKAAGESAFDVDHSVFDVAEEEPGE